MFLREKRHIGSKPKDLTAIADHFGAAFVLIGAAIWATQEVHWKSRNLYFALGNYQTLDNLTTNNQHHCQNPTGTLVNGPLQSYSIRCDSGFLRIHLCSGYGDCYVYFPENSDIDAISENILRPQTRKFFASPLPSSLYYLRTLWAQYSEFSWLAPFKSPIFLLLFKL